MLVILIKYSHINHRDVQMDKNKRKERRGKAEEHTVADLPVVN